MDEFEEPLQAMFADHVDSVYRSLDAMLQPLDAAVSRLCQCMLEDHRILVCGTGLATALAQMFAATFLAKSRIDRPGLPVIGLGGDCITMSAIAQEYAFSEVHARQIQALGQPGDTLFLIAGGREAAPLVAALHSARGLGLQVVVMTHGDGGDIASLLEAEDIELRIPSDDPLRVGECQVLALNCIVALIEMRLFGEG